MAYKRKPTEYNERLARIRDEQLAEVNRSLQDDALVVHEDGRVTLSCLPAMTFPTRECARQFLCRVTRTRRMQ